MWKVWTRRSIDKRWLVSNASSQEGRTRAIGSFMLMRPWSLESAAHWKSIVCQKTTWPSTKHCSMSLHWLSSQQFLRRKVRNTSWSLTSLWTTKSSRSGWMNWDKQTERIRFVSSWTTWAATVAKKVKRRWPSLALSGSITFRIALSTTPLNWLFRKLKPASKVWEPES